MSARLDILADGWRQRVADSAQWLRERGFSGRAGLVLGSGLGNFVESLGEVQAVDYGDIPGFTTTTVAEHRGRMITGLAGDARVLVMQGRLHPYEKLSFDEMLLPTAVLAGLDIETALVTNAAGGLNRFFEPGDLMVIRDQLDMHSVDPLRGLLRGPDSSTRAGRAAHVFDRELARTLVEAGAESGVSLHTGTYASMWGPAYETRAEIGMLRRIGADAVGMSTAPESVLLSRLGVRVVGLSCITNPAREVGQPELSHQDVVETGAKVRDRMARLLLAFLSRVA